MQNLTFSYLIDSINTNLFFNEYWEKSILHIKREDPNYYNPIFNENLLNSLIWRSDFPWSKIQLANHNRKASHQDYSALPPNLITLTQAYDQGDTIIINDIQNKLESLGWICRNISKEFNFLSNINLYLTKSMEQGLNPHFDDQDVFILQISGAKKWMIYESPVLLPLDNNIRVESNFIYNSPREELILNPGDLLYIPRGVAHAAKSCSHTHSLHLTLSVTAIRWSNILSTLLQLVSENQLPFRESIPINTILNDKDKGSYQSLLKNLAEKLMNSIDSNLINESFNFHKLNFIRALKPLDDNFITNTDFDITITSKLRRRYGIIIHYELIKGDIHVFFPGGSFVAPISLLKTINFIIENEYFFASSLPIEDTDSSKVQVSIELIKQGIICKG